MADYNTVKANLAKRAAPKQTYGKAKEQMIAQELVPMGPPPTTTNIGREPVPKRKSPGDFFRSTERPNEPITAGVDFGPGVSSVGAGIPRYSNDIVMMEIKEILKYFPNDDLFDLVSRYGGG